MSEISQKRVDVRKYMRNSSIARFANGCHQNVENIENPKY